ncbi:hypothetical protein [Marinobacter sp. C18]|uniref:hypothetical protein n=1 Tax=Marinobacter sp. C18 TaxID=1772288 RepID=UPI000AFFAB4E|nr:hypothetical protein [Marinobacter sp. C18]
MSTNDQLQKWRDEFGSIVVELPNGTLVDVPLNNVFPGHRGLKTLSGDSSIKAFSFQAPNANAPATVILAAGSDEDLSINAEELRKRLYS